MFDIYYLIELIFLLLACYSCFLAGRSHGAAAFVGLLLEYKVVTKAQLNRFQQRLEREMKE